MYFDLVSNSVVDEVNEDIFVSTVRNLSSVISYFIPHNEFNNISTIMYNKIINLLQKDNLSDNQIKNYLSFVIEFACTEDHISFLKDWLVEGPFILNENKNKKMIKSDLLSQELRFSILIFIFTSIIIDDKTKNDLLEQEVKRDNNSDKSARVKLSCNAAKPCLKTKKELWETYISNPSFDSLHNVRASMSGFVFRNQLDIVEEFVKDRFCDDLLLIADKCDHYYLETFIKNLNPGLYVTKEVIDKLSNLLQVAINKKNISMKTELSIIIDDMKTKLKAREISFSDKIADY